MTERNVPKSIPMYSVSVAMDCRTLLSLSKVPWEGIQNEVAVVR